MKIYKRKKNRVLRLIDLFLSLGALAFSKKKWGPFLDCFNETKFDYSFRISWSQSGEDLAIENILNSAESSKFYLDVGAHHPSRFSVTRLLYQSGWRGINIDANSDLEKDFKLNRPRDIFLNFAVGNLEAYHLYIGDELAVSTTNLDWKSKFESQGMAYHKVLDVKGITLRKVIEMDLCPDRIALVNIDIEGADYQALVSAQLPDLSKDKWPLFFLIESQVPLSEAMKLDSVQYLLSLGYEIWLLLPFATLLKAPE